MILQRHPITNEIVQEEFREIENYEGLYEISNYGRIKSLERIVKNRFSSRIVSERILNFNIDKDGYHLVSLSHKSKVSKKKVHQLVAIAFLNHTPCGLQIVVDHRDMIKNNNFVHNLQLITNRENLSRIKRGSSKYTGVHLDKKSKKWRSSIRIKGRKKSLGSFDSELEASNAYQKELKNIRI